MRCTTGYAVAKPGLGKVLSWKGLEVARQEDPEGLYAQSVGEPMGPPGMENTPYPA